jgi:bacillithiol biosynthesis cysteine-adding enzyme BshC
MAAFMSRAFSAAFLDGDPGARALLPADFRDPATRIAQARRASERAVPAPVLEALAAQNAELPPSAARQENLEALSRRGTTVVITGQQVGLFLGPLYTYYKAATAVAAARALERESGVRCVPLFWLQTEDHDFAEIAAAQVLSADSQPVRVSIAPDPGLSARSAVAHRRLGPDVEGALSALAQALGPAPGAAEVIALMRAHYRPGVPLAQAFAGALAALFAEDGLLVFNPRTPALARLAAPIYRRAIEDHEGIAGCLAERGDSLRAAGLAEQVPCRRTCALVFFHDGDAQGPRYRLERSDPAAPWTLAGTGKRIDAQELRAALADDPLRFSTSALLRPLVQDTLFPTAAYVGGPAELGYFAQLGPLYDRLDVPQPLVVLRARFRCLDDKGRQLLSRLKLQAKDLERPLAAVLRALAENLPAGDLPAPSALAAEMTSALEPALARLQSAAVAADRTLSRPAERTRSEVRRSIERLCDKYALALARRDQTNLRRIERLSALLFPEGTPQERFYGWPSMAARVGPAAFARAVRAGIDPFSPAVGELCP